APPPVSANPFDFNVFQTQIQPILDTAEGKGCTNANCHGSPAGIGGMKLVANPAANSADMQANFTAITSRTNLSSPDQSKFYLQATLRHASGNSALVSTSQAASILSWIQTAAQNAPTGGGTVSPNCANPSNFNVGVFATEIQPILFGT